MSMRIQTIHTFTLMYVGTYVYVHNIVHICKIPIEVRNTIQHVHIALFIRP